MTYFEAKIQLETDESLNQVNSKILSALFAADIDAAGVQVEEFATTPVYDAADEDADEYDYDEVQTFGSPNILRYPTYRATQEDYAPHPQTRKTAGLADIEVDSHTADLIAALKANGDRYGDI